MIIIGGELPHVEKPEPLFGGVISSMNKLVNLLGERETAFKDKVEIQMKDIEVLINKYVADVPKIPLEHTKKTGPQHGETAKSVGLPLRDNVRNATTTEVLTSAPVNAVVKITDLRSALEENLKEDIEGFQKNDVFPVGGFNEPRLVPVGNSFKIPDIIHKYKPGHVNLMASGDRLIASARPAGPDDHFSLFYSDPTRVSKNSFEEMPYALTYFNGWGWNMTSGGTIDGKVALFRPIPDKGVYIFNTDLFSDIGTNYMMYNNFGEMIYRGVAMRAYVTGTKVTVEHRLFTVKDPLEIDPILINSLPNTYMASFETINKKGLVQPMLQDTVYDFKEFVNLTGGVTIEYDTTNDVPLSPTMCWSSADTTYYANVAIPVILKAAGKVVKAVLTFTEVRTPGNLQNGSVGKVTMLNGLVKDNIDDKLIVTGLNFFTENNVSNPANPVGVPGSILSDGTLINAMSSAKSIRIKYSTSVFHSATEFVEKMTESNPIPKGITRRYCSRRYNAFGAIPERILPIYNQAGETRFCVYNLDDSNGLMTWKEYKWFHEDIFRATTSGHSFSVKKPDEVNDIPISEDIPKSLSIYAGMATGINIYSLCFTPANNFKTFSTVDISKDGVVLGDEVVLDHTSLMACKIQLPNFLQRAKAEYGDDYPETEKSEFFAIHAIDDARAMLMFSDGISHVEGNLVNYKVLDGVFSITTNVAKLDLKVLSILNKVPAGYKRKSSSGDDVGYFYNDLNIWRQTTSGLYMSYPRAFGDLLGDVSFFLSGTTVTPIKTNKGRFYDNKFIIDMADELHPPVMIPRKAMLYETGVIPTGENQLTTMLSVVSSGVTFDPYAAPDKSYFMVPHGKRLVVGGRGVIVEHGVYIGIPDTGDRWCYIVRDGDSVKIIVDNNMREPDNNEVLIVRRVNGTYVYSEEYLVMDNHLVSFDRHGSCIPVTWDDGTPMGVNKFFKHTDILPG